MAIHCQKYPPPSYCLDGRGWGNWQNNVSAREPPLLSFCFSNRLQALSLVLVIPFLNYFSQVIVSSCCREIFSHRVTMTFISKTKAPPIVHRKYIAKLLCPQIPGELTEQGNTADEVLEGFLLCLKETDSYYCNF